MATRALLVAGLVAGCAGNHQRLRAPPARAFDAVVVPGCPSEDDGSLSRCQMARAGWAAMLWERGFAHYFIVSGAAVHSAYVEADAIAAAMAALDVPPERIYIEPNALHTDENMYDALQIARRVRLRTIAVVGEGAGPDMCCAMMARWGQPCTPLPADVELLRPRLAAAHPRLDRIRVPRAPGFLPIAERERRRSVETGRPPRPPSWILYPSLRLLDLAGTPWIPFAPTDPVAETFADRNRRRAGKPGLAHPTP